MTLPPRNQLRQGPPPRMALPPRPKAQAEMPPLSKPEVNKDPQQSLFDTGEDWQKEWQAMPEFIQEAQKPYMTILMHFDSWENVQKFAALVEQKINAETKYMWFPKADLKRVSKFRYVDTAVCPSCKEMQEEGGLCSNPNCDEAVPY